MKRILSFICLFCMVFSIIAPSAAAADTPNDWIMNIQNIDIVERLESTQTMTNYDGSTYTETYVDEPTDGNCFVIVLVALTKQNVGASGLPVNEIQLNVEGKSFSAESSSNFLKNHNYDTFESASVLVSDMGALCFEIPESYLGSNGDGWYVSYGDLTSAPYMADLVQEIPYGKNDVEIQEQYEAAVLSQYNSVGPLSLNNAMIVQDLYGNAPLTAVALFDTDTACDVTVTVHGKTPEADITYTVGDVVTQHQVPIFGLYAGMENKVTITAGNESYDHYITTDPIPEDMTIKIVAHEDNDVTQIADGQLYMLQEINHTIFDVNGDIRWYLGERYTANASLDYSNSFAMYPQKDGMWISYNPSTGWVYNNNCELIYITWTGKIRYKFSYQNNYSDHDSTILPDGNIMYYAEANVLKYIDVSTGKMYDYLRMDELFDSSVGNLNYENISNTTDWAHSNTVEYISENNSLLISLRNQHLIANIDYETKEIIWAMTPAYSIVSGEVQAKQSILNDVLILPDKSDTDFEWFYCQHDPTFISYDEQTGIFEFVVFDNGSYRYVYGEEEPNDLKYSRIVHYAVDLNNRSVKQVFEYGKEAGEELYSPTYGSAQMILRSGHYLGNFRGHNTTYPDSSIIVEVDSTGNVVAEFEAVITQSNAGTYRADAFFLGEESFSDCGLGKDYGFSYYGYGQKNWQLTNSPQESPRTFSSLNLDEFFTNGDSLYTYGTAMVADSAYTTKFEILAVETTSNQCYGFTMGTCRTNDGKFYGRGVPLNTLPDGEYMLYIRGTNASGITASEFTGYKLTKGSQAVATSDILTVQDSVNQSLATYVSQGNYSIRKPYITVDPYGISPLAAIASFRTSKLASITVEVESKNGADPIVNQFETVSTEHQIPIYGLYANEDTQVKLTAHYQDGTSETSTISVKGNSLPSDFVPVRVDLAETAQMADGWTFIMAGSLQGYVYAIDETGAVRWLLSEKGLGAAGSLLPLSNGNYLIGGDKSFGQYYKYNLFELNMTGQIVNEYLVNGYHHDAQELPDGNLLILANNVNGDIVEDTMYEIDRSSGDIIRTWDLNSYFNVGNYNEAGQHISDVNYGADTHDWLHTNGMDYDEETNSVLISCRHQDAVFSMSLDTGEINWILSNPDDLWPDYLKDKLLTPVGSDFEWQYGQHNISLLPNGDIMMFDNGDYRSKDAASVLPATEGYSRAVIYRIDKENMTVSQVWEFGKELGSAPLAAYVSSSQYLGENHYLIDFGGIVKDSNGNATYNIMDGIQGSSQSQIYEVKDGEIIFHASVERSGLHGNTFRAARMMPYATTSELNLADSGNRLGGLYRYGLAEAIEFDSSIAVFGAPDVQVSDNGVQLQMTSDLGNTGTESKLAIVFANDESAYKVTLPSGTSIAYTLNNSEIPTGTYELYLVKDNITYDLKLEWTNTSGYCAFPAAYDIVVETNQGYEDLVSGSGTYYANTPFTLNATENESYQFKGWYVGDKLLSTDANYTMTATSDMTITAKFFGYTDVDKTSWYYDAVYYVSKNDIMTGYSETQFAPNDTLSRAQACQVIYNIVDAEEQATEAVFSDVTLGQWYTNAIAWATKNNVVSGYGNNLFGPNDAITREQMAVILYRYAGAPSVETDHLASYTDADQISSWATDALNWCVENKIMVGNGSGIEPNQVITRAEVATIMMNFVIR